MHYLYTQKLKMIRYYRNAAVIDLRVCLLVCYVDCSQIVSMGTSTDILIQVSPIDSNNPIYN